MNEVMEKLLRELGFHYSPDGTLIKHWENRRNEQLMSIAYVGWVGSKLNPAILVKTANIDKNESLETTPDSAALELSEWVLTNEVPVEE